MPADTFRLATFNAENLFARYRFRQAADPYADETGFTINDVAFDIYDGVEKKITAEAIRSVNADIICLQEVESLPTLDRFKTQYLASMRPRYHHRILIDGNDPRAIDVAVMARAPCEVVALRTHRHERSSNHPGQPLFSRDCLEVDFRVGGRPFTVLVNHFKSMMEGRQQTRQRRLEQVKRVADLVKQEFEDGSRGNFAVLGDFNDYFDNDTDSALGPLVGRQSELKLVDVVANLSPDEQWTHFYAKGNEKKQLDHILLPRSLGMLEPEVMRRGLPYRAGDYDQFEGVGENDPKASDHCPVFVDIPLDLLT